MAEESMAAARGNIERQEIGESGFMVTGVIWAAVSCRKSWAGSVLGMLLFTSLPIWLYAVGAL
jgi:hypothetical protein